METESKYIVPDEATFNKIRKMPGIAQYTRQEPRTKTVHDRYVDTPEHLFYSNKYFVRLRESASGAAPLLTIKHLGGPVEGAVHNREEFETEVSGLEIAGWPEGEPKRLAQEIAGDRSLTDFVNVDQKRIVSVLVDGDRAVAEMSLDEIVTQTSTEPVRAYELEVELLPDGTIEDLRTIDARLEKQYKLVPQPLSKFERAVMLSSTPTPGENGAAAVGTAQETNGSRNGKSKKSKAERGGVAVLDPAPVVLAAPATAEKEKQEKKKAGVLPTDDMDTAARKLLGFYYDSLLSNEEGTKEGTDPEALHDMRVATRRMRAVLQVFESYLESEPAGQLRRGLRSVTRALGAVRDLDVLLEHAEKFCEELPEEERPGLQSLIDAWEASRKEGRTNLRQVLNSKEYARFKKRLGEYLEEQSAGEDTSNPDVQPHQVRHVVASAVWEKYEAVRAFETVMETPTVEQLHNLRIKSKYLRYTLESFREVLPSSAEGLIKDIVSVQDMLGVLHDAVVGSEQARSFRDNTLRKTKKSKKADNGDESVRLEGLEKYINEREGTVRRLTLEFPALWARISGQGWRSTLAKTIAAL